MSLAEIYNIEEENDFSKKTQKKLDLINGNSLAYTACITTFS